MNKERLIVKTALETIEIEALTIESLKKGINNNFVEIVQYIYQSKGRIIITGIGKSAVIAQKIVATFNSTGTPAIFMHAADAIHGDLGMITPDDLVLCISKSGETPEIRVLVPLLKHLGNKLIGMVSNEQSYLGLQADYVLHTPIAKEADPNNLAPTASTTAQMALGDALATSLLALRGFTPVDFAQFHPGGALGKQLYLKVSGVYTQNEKPAVQDDANVRAIIVEITSKRLGATVVLDENQRVLGIITDGDLRRMLEKHENTKHLRAIDIMSANPKTIQQSELAVNALTLMRQNSITQLVVLEGEAYAGIIHLHDLLREGLI